jgi:hypothetical protein
MSDDRLQTSDERLLTPAEVADMLAVKPETLAQWRLRRDGPRPAPEPEAEQ